MRAKLEDTLRRWAAAWTGSICPHSYALLRIVFGLNGLLALAGLTPIEMFWPIDSLAPIPSGGFFLRAWLLAHGLGTVSGWVFFAALLVIFAAMTVGYYSNASVTAGFFGLVAQVHWNANPLSSAHQVLVVLLFCLMWADTGRVWSLDARLRAASPEPFELPAWPLLLMRCQIALIYLSSGLWKISYPMWRDGSAVHWALSLNAFHRLPWPVPVELAPAIAVTTWATVLFELLFAPLVFFRKTRYATLVAGICLHVGLWATLELGPFSILMICTYIAFIEPARVATLLQRTPDRPEPAPSVDEQPVPDGRSEIV